MYGNVLDIRFLCIMRLRKELIEKYENADIIDYIIELACIKMARSVYYQEFAKTNNISLNGRLAMYLSKSYTELELFTQLYEYQCIGSNFSYPTQIRGFLKNPYNLPERNLYLKWLVLCQTPTYKTNIKIQDMLNKKPIIQLETIKIRIWFVSKERLWNKELNSNSKEYWKFTTESIENIREFIEKNDTIPYTNEILYDVPIKHNIKT
jgi:hypothetical protein